MSKNRNQASQLATENEEVQQGGSEMENTENAEKVETSQNLSIMDKINMAMTIDESSHFQQVEGKGGEITEIVKKQYTFVEPIGKRSQISVYDVDIINSLDKIQSAINGRKYLNYVIAKELSNINESGKLENMGFKNIAELGKSIFGLESSTVNHYARIGKFFINADYSIKGALPDISISHLLELSKLVDEETGDISQITEMYTNGTLIDGMSTKKIREVVNQLSIEDKGEEKENDEKQEEANPTTDATATKINEETPIETLSAEFDKQVVVGQIVNSVSRINELFSLLNKNDVKTSGYNEALELLQNLALQLLQ